MLTSGEFLFYYSIISTFAAEIASRVLKCTPTELTLCHGGKTMRVKRVLTKMITTCNTNELFLTNHMPL